VRIFVNQDHPDRFHLVGDARVAAVASDDRGARVAFTAEGTACESSWADDELGLVGVGFEQFGVDVWRVA
jgi:hypothetical protein